MSATADLQILINAKNQSQQALSAAGKDVDGLTSRIGGLAKAGGLLAAGGLAAGAFAVANFVKAAADEQKGMAQLEQAVRNTGYAFEDAGNVFDEHIQKAQQLAFSDDDARLALTQLTNATGNYKEAQSRLNVAMDLARGTGMDLAMASKLVGKVSDENTQVLKKYGITLKEGSTEQEALAEIQARFAGQSEAYAGTAAAKWEIFNIQMDNIKETIGGALLPTVTMLGTALGDFLTRHQDDIDAFAQALAEKIPQGIAAIVAAFQQVRPQLEFVFQQMREGFEVIKPGLQWVIDNKPVLVAALVAVGAAMLLAFSPVTLPILAVVAAIGALLFILGTSKEEWRAYLTFLDELWENIQTAIEDKLGIIGTVIVFYMDTYRNIVETTIKVIRDVIVIVMALIQGDWSAAWDGVKQLLSDVWNGIVTDIGLKLGLLQSMLSFAWDVVAMVATFAWGKIKDAIVGAMDGAKEGVRGAINGLIGFVEGGVNGIIDGINGLLEKARELDRSLPEAISPWDVPGNLGHVGIPRLETGLYNVGPAPMLAVLDPYERVLNRQDADASRNGRGGSSGGLQNVHVTVTGPVYLQGDPATGLAAMGLTQLAGTT